MNLLKRNDKGLNDTCMIERIIQSLDLKVDYILVAIEESKNLDIVNIGQLIMKSLHVHG